MTFVRNHAKAIVVCDFCTVVTATCRVLYVFVLMEYATRRILHCNVTMHPTTQWTIQQLREAMPAELGSTSSTWHPHQIWWFYDIWWGLSLPSSGNTLHTVIENLALQSFPHASTGGSETGIGLA